MKKGFTLIELLAVIIILGIIALITTPMILDIIETSKMKSAKSSALGYIDTLEKQITVNELTTDSQKIKDNIYDNFQELSETYGVNVKGTIPTTGWIKIKNNQVVDYSLLIDEYVVNSDGTTIKNGQINEKPIRTYYVGDLVSIENENFYVINDNDNVLTLIAKYNLNVGSNKSETDPEGLQSESATGWTKTGKNPWLGTVGFSEVGGMTPGEIDINRYEGEVKTALNNYKELLEKTGINIKNIRLITSPELIKLGCDEDNKTCLSAPEWIYKTTYWIGSTTAKNCVSYVGSDGDFGTLGARKYSLGGIYGVRPVIEISKTELN